MPMKRDYSLVGPENAAAVSKGLANAQWYRCAVPRKQMKELMQRSDAAAIRDTILWVLLFILFATGLVYAVAVHQTHGLQHRSGLVGSCFVVLGLYFVGLWVRSGQTLAMKTWHLRVVAADGRPLAPRRALLRYLLAWVWVLPPLMVAKALALPSAGADFGLVAAWIVLYAASARLHPRRQFWHDAICGTAIVTARPATALPA